MMINTANIPQRGTKILNKKTGRMVTVGGQAWQKLVKAGEIPGMYNDPKQLEDIKDDADIKKQKEKLDEELPDNYHTVKGRGRYKGKLVKRKKPMNPKRAISLTSKALARAIKLEEIEDLNNMSIKQLQDRLEKLTEWQMTQNNEDLESAAKPIASRNNDACGPPQLTRSKSIRIPQKPPKQRNRQGRFVVKNKTQNNKFKAKRRSGRSTPYNTPDDAPNSECSDFDTVSSDRVGAAWSDDQASLSILDFSSDSDSTAEEPNHSNGWLEE